MFYQGDDKVSLSFKIIKKSSALQSYKKGDSLVTYFNLVAANKDGTYIVRVYLKHKYNFIKEGMSYRFTGKKLAGTLRHLTFQDATIRNYPQVYKAQKIIKTN